MAGLCGVIALTDGLDTVGLNRRLVSKLRHRGSDGVHEWSGEGAAIAYLALDVRVHQPAVIQPLRLADGRICVVDGRVGNPGALLRALGCPAGMPEPGDAQCIAMAIERWDVEFWRQVHGDFAAALWDPATRKLLLVRDQLGVRPLFHLRTRDLVAFCSEPEPLFELPGVSGRIRDLTVAEVWTQLPFTQAGWSDVEGAVDVLPPAHRMCVDAKGVMVAERYWQLAPRPLLQLADEREYVEAFQDVFARACANATHGVDTSALMLSGGIDSGAILAASRGFRLGAPATGLLCISAVTDDATADPGSRAETANIRALTAGNPDAIQFTVPILENTGEGIEAADAAEVAWGWRHPVDASVYIPSLACRVARQRGARVILSGAGGDMVTSSPRHYAGRLLLQGRWGEAWREAQAASRVHTYLHGLSPLRILGTSTLAELQPVAVRKLRARRGLAGDLHAIRNSGLSPEFLRDAGIEAAYAASLGHRLAVLELTFDERRCRTLAARLDDTFRGFNQVVARQGLDARDPWVDMEVVNFFLSLPLAWQVREGWTKYLPRRACEDALGADVAWHSGKRHHGPLVTRQLVVDAAPYLRGYLRAMRPCLMRYMSAGLLSEVDQTLANPQEISPAHADRANALVALAGWLERQGIA